jgi:hypothetical protein
VRSLSPPDATGGAQMIDGGPAAAAARIAEIVRDRLSA